MIKIKDDIDEKSKKLQHVKRSNKKVEKKEAPDKASQDTEELDDLHEEEEKEENSKRLFFILGAVVTVVLAIILIVFLLGSKEKVSENSAEGTTTGSFDEFATYSTKEVPNDSNAVYDEFGNLISEDGIYDKDGNIIDNTAIAPGTPDYSESEKNKTTAKVYSPDEWIKDLNGIDTSAVYNVKDRSYITDYVNYKARRAIMDDGMELYWLEATYHGKPYRIQVPFYYFKDLSEEGICRVEIELLTLENNTKIISFMQVVSDDYGRED